MKTQRNANSRRKSPRELGRESAGQDVDCPFGQYDEDTAAWDEWHEGREEAAGRERARAQEPDPIRDAIDRAAVQLFADLDLVAVICPHCKTELAFPGDVCGLCKPGELPRLC